MFEGVECHLTGFPFQRPSTLVLICAILQSKFREFAGEFFWQPRASAAACATTLVGMVCRLWRRRRIEWKRKQSRMNWIHCWSRVGQLGRGRDKRAGAGTRGLGAAAAGPPWWASSLARRSPTIFLSAPTSSLSNAFVNCKHVFAHVGF